MNFFQAITLAFVQGLTEFLPVSSSGHLVFLQKIFRFAEAPIFFDVLLHLGSLTAIIFFFRKEILELIFNFKNNLKIWLFLIVGSIPAAVFGIVFKSKIKLTFNSISAVGIAWILFGILLMITKFIGREKKYEKTEIKKLSFLDAILIGLFQAIALFPGISRSGSTIIGGFLRGLSREAAFKFSFLLSIPAILGATVLEVSPDNFKNIDIFLAVFSMTISGLVGYFALIFLQKILKSEKFHYFGFYCLLMGIIALAFFK